MREIAQLVRRESVACDQTLKFSSDVAGRRIYHITEALKTLKASWTDITTRRYRLFLFSTSGKKLTSLLVSATFDF